MTGNIKLDRKVVPLRSNKRSLDVIERNISFYKIRDHKSATLWSHNLIKGLWCNKRKMVKHAKPIYFLQCFIHKYGLWMQLTVAVDLSRLIIMGMKCKTKNKTNKTEQNRPKHVQLHNLIYTTNKSSLYTQLHFDLNYKLMNDTSYLQATLIHTQMILVHWG